MVDDHGDRVPEAEEEDEERVVHVAQMALSPQLLVLLLTAIKRRFRSEERRVGKECVG